MIAFATLAATALLSSGVTGRVTTSPTCPVVTQPPNPACAPRPFAAHVTASRDGRILARTVAGSDGRYRLRLAAGRYRITAGPRPGVPFPRSESVTVRVSSHRFHVADLDLDSGIRRRTVLTG